MAQQEPERTIGKPVTWDHPRRGKQTVTVLLRGTHKQTVVIRHDDQQTGAKRIYVPPVHVDAIRALLDQALIAMEDERDDRRQLFDDGEVD